MIQCVKGLGMVHKYSRNITSFVQCIFPHLKHGHQAMLGAMIFSKICRNSFESLSLMKVSILKAVSQTCSSKKRVLKNFSRFIGKHQYQGLFFNKVVGLRPAISKNTFS